LYSAILTNYHGWTVAGTKHDVHSRISIHAGTRLTQQYLTITNKINHIASGIVKDNAAPLFSHKGDENHFGYIATYGKQSLNSDQLGLAVFFKASVFIEQTEDANSHIVKLKPDNGRLTYYFLAAWEKEPGGITNKKEFEDYLNRIARELANPIQVTILTKE
jgi:hypothetical protein